MSIVSRMRKQTAVYWGLAHNDSGGVAYSDYGKPLYTSPIEIDCRWSDKNEEVLDMQGRMFLSRATVYVDRDVDISGVLLLGDLDDVTDSDNPFENTGAWEIQRFDKIPNLRATEFLRKVFL